MTYFAPHNISDIQSYFEENFSYIKLSIANELRGGALQGSLISNDILKEKIKSNGKNILKSTFSEKCFKHRDKLCISL